MPPAISDIEDEGESSGIDAPEQIPAKAAKGKAPAKAVSEEPEDDDEEDGSGEEDEYSVDKIVAHQFQRGVLKYKVKWLGYDDEADMTWEPLENLETASEKLAEYHKNNGGTPEPPTKGKKKGAVTNKRKASEIDESPAPSATKKRPGRKSATNGDADTTEAFTLPKGSWEKDVAHVMSIVQEEEPEEKKGKTNVVLFGFLMWNDGRKSKHPMTALRTKCPQHLINYYENHLVFSKTEDVPAHLKD